MFASANTAQFELLIPSVRNDFKVLAFKGTEAISALYAIQVELVSEYPGFDLQSLLRQPAFLQSGLNGEGIHGYIEDVAVYRQMLNEPKLSPEQRLDNLCAELQRQSLTEKEPFA